MAGPSKTARAIDWDTLPHGGDLFGELHLAEVTAAPERRAPLFPGLALCAVGAAAAAWLAGFYGFPIILLGLLIGLALNFVSHDPRTHAGLDFASRTCLRWGIVVLGLQVTFAQIGALGVAPFVALAGVMVATLLAGLGGARLAGQSREAGVLAGLPRLAQLPDNIPTLVSLKQELDRAGGKVKLIGQDAPKRFAEKIDTFAASTKMFRDEMAAFIDKNRELDKQLKQLKIRAYDQGAVLKAMLTQCLSIAAKPGKNWIADRILALLPAFRECSQGTQTLGIMH